MFEQIPHLDETLLGPSPCIILIFKKIPFAGRWHLNIKYAYMKIFQIQYETCFMTNMNTEMIISISYIMIYEYETCVYM